MTFRLRQLPNVVFTPHLGASTLEAQESVGIEIAEAIRSVLIEGVIRNAVNVPNLDAKTLAIIGPYLDLGEKLGRFLRQVSPRRCDKLHINYSGKVNETETSPISRYVLKGFLEEVGGQEVNQVNVTSLAQTLGLQVVETRESVTGEFTDLIEMQVEGEGEKAIRSRHVRRILTSYCPDQRPLCRGAAGWYAADFRE